MKQPTTAVTSAVKAGDPLAALKAVADQLAERLDDPDTPPHAVAPISRELSRTLQAIADLEVVMAPRETMAEALAAARAARLTATPARRG
jgi:hypothetical protein